MMPSINIAIKVQLGCDECYRSLLKKGRETEALRLQVERWQDVAYIDGADVTARARKEGIDVENPDEMATFVREFYAKPETVG